MSSCGNCLHFIWLIWDLCATFQKLTEAVRHLIVDSISHVCLNTSYNHFRNISRIFTTSSIRFFNRLGFQLIWQNMLVCVKLISISQSQINVERGPFWWFKGCTCADGSLSKKCKESCPLLGDGVMVSAIYPSLHRYMSAFI